MLLTGAESAEAAQRAAAGLDQQFARQFASFRPHREEINLVIVPDDLQLKVPAMTA